MAYNPNAIFISPSSMSTFKSCPQAYYYAQVYRSSKRGLKIQLTNPKLALGQAVHDTLSQFLYGQGVTKSKDQLVNILNRFWNEIAGEKGGFTSTSEEKIYKERALKMLEVFWSNEHFQITVPVKMPDFPKFDLGEDLILTGKLDWIEDEGNKNYHIIDFKTGEKEERSDSVQLPVYALLVSNLLKPTKLRASYWYLDRGVDLKSYDLPDLKKTLEELKKLGMVIKASRLTNSFRCSSGFESCWACKGFIGITKGEAKLVAVDYSRKTEIYVMNDNIEKLYADDLPF